MTNLLIGDFGIDLSGLDVRMTRIRLTVSIGTPLDNSMVVAAECLAT